jgi:hypothetical protein
MNKTISKENKYYLEYLLNKVSMLQMEIENLYREAVEITGEDYYTFDFIYNGEYDTTDIFLDEIGIMVEDEI